MADSTDVALTPGLRDGRTDAGTVFAELRQIYFNARFDAAEFNAPQVQWAAMVTLVDLIHQVINDVTVARSKIKNQDDGLLGFDGDLAGVTARYTHMYKTAIEKDFDLTDRTQYAVFEKFLEGPILLWDLKTCKEKWPTSIGYCEGPDLLTALSLLHQVGVAEDFERQLLESYVRRAHTVFREMVETAEGVYDAAAARTKEALKAAGDALVEAHKAVVETVGEHIAKPAAKTLAITLGIGAAVLVSYGAWRLKKEEQDRQRARNEERNQTQPWP